jgi:serine O-acetyltransferase
MTSKDTSLQTGRDAAWLWQRIRSEAERLACEEPVLASFFHAALLGHGSLASALAFLLASKLGDRDIPAMLLRQVCDAICAGEPGLVEAAAADICAHYDRDPACTDYATPLLYFKGFHAVQSYRFAHALWRTGRHGLALYLQCRIASVFDVDIHPAARIGSGLMVDHATGVVIGETAELGDNISMLHGVTLGGSGISEGRRHPCVGDGVLIAAGARLLGPITVGASARIAAGSVVLADVPAHTTVAGVPARAVGHSSIAPALDMDQSLTGD